MIFCNFVDELLNIEAKHFDGNICIVTKEGTVSKNGVCEHCIFGIYWLVKLSGIQGQNISYLMEEVLLVFIIFLAKIGSE